MTDLHELPLALRQGIELLTRDRLPSEIPAEVIRAVKRAGFLDLLGTRPELRERAEIARAFMSQAAEGAIKLRDLREVSVALGGAGIVFAPLKGMAYSLMFEQGGPTRAMADIDLLVRSEQVEDASRVLVDLGYHLEHPVAIARAAGYHERTFVRNARIVELHSSFLPRARLGIDYQEMWSRALPLDREGVTCRRLSREDTLLVHTQHMGTHEFVTGLTPVWELRRLIREDRPDLATCAFRAREWGCLRMTWCALLLLEICFSGTVSAENLQLFEPSDHVRALLEAHVVRPSLAQIELPRRLPRVEQLLRKALLVDNLSNALAYMAWYAGAWVQTR